MSKNRYHLLLLIFKVYSKNIFEITSGYYIEFIILKKGNKKKSMIKLEKSSNLQYSSEESN